MAAATRTGLDIRRFPWMRRLAADYAYDYPRLSGFFAGDPQTPDAWRSAIGLAQQHPRNRTAIADVIISQQRRRGAPPEAIVAAEQLRDARTVAVLTGQQAGLFGGPLFTLLKAATALRLATRAAGEHDVPVVPIFWVDAEDHDWDEVRACHVFGPGLEERTVTLADQPGARAGSVARVVLDAQVSSALDALRAALPPSEFTDEVMTSLSQAYAVGHGMADAFARWMESVLGRHGLVVFDASDAAAKPLASRVFTHELEHPGETARLVNDTSAALEALGYHAQITPNDANLALFSLAQGREPIRRDGDAFVCDDAQTTQVALLARAQSTPESFSPNVLLRPLVQDTLFPTVCYVAGPSELAYLGQLSGVYRAFDVPMPLVYPRASATIVDTNALRFLTRQALPFESLRAQDDGALNDLLQAQLPQAVEAAMDAAVTAVDERLTVLATEVRQLDATLEAATTSVRGRMQDDLKKLQGKIIQAAKRKDETLRRQFVHARAQAFPSGHPQEREIGFVSFLNAYGPPLVDRLLDELPLDVGQHWLIAP